MNDIEYKLDCCKNKLIEKYAFNQATTEEKREYMSLLNEKIMYMKVEQQFSERFQKWQETIKHL